MEGFRLSGKQRNHENYFSFLKWLQNLEGYLHVFPVIFQVVHNYGHGANGISLAWGTSVDAAHLVLESLGRKANL